MIQNCLLFINKYYAHLCSLKSVFSFIARWNPNILISMLKWFIYLIIILLGLVLLSSEKAVSNLDCSKMCMQNRLCSFFKFISAQNLCRIWRYGEGDATCISDSDKCFKQKIWIHIWETAIGWIFTIVPLWMEIELLHESGENKFTVIVLVYMYIQSVLRIFAQWRLHFDTRWRSEATVPICCLYIDKGVGRI